MIFKLTHYHTSGRNRISERQLISGTWQASFYGYDGSGHVRLLTDSLGTVTDTYDYDSFGNTANSTGSTPNSYLYRGEQFDTDLGLYYLRARYLNPATGRFLTRDPEAGKRIDPVTLHKYLYSENDPVNKSDPSGKATTAENLLLAGGLVFTGAVLGNLLPGSQIDGQYFTPAGALIYCILQSAASLLDNASILASAYEGIDQSPAIVGACTFAFPLLKSRLRSRGGTFGIRDPGKDENGKCNPCPPPPGRCDDSPPSPPHPPCTD